ncbi:hypothetical protein ACP26L_11320 [Paenibacillus sp. S-38]|uniref:hypothetical protein n=1 Tax=Paenibacillus sp. S-38 TaxID=3416710 RepID=UPI003CED7D4E
MDVKYLIHWQLFLIFMVFISKYEMFYGPNGLIWILLISVGLGFVDYLLAKLSTKVSLLNQRVTLPVMIGAVIAGAVLFYNLL